MSSSIAVLASCLPVMSIDASCPCSGHMPAGNRTQLLPQAGKVLACMQIARDTHLSAESASPSCSTQVRAVAHRSSGNRRLPLTCSAACQACSISTERWQVHSLPSRPVQRVEQDARTQKECNRGQVRPAAGSGRLSVLPLGWLRACWACHAPASAGRSQCHPL